MFEDVRWVGFHPPQILLICFQGVEYVCIDGMKMDINFYQISVKATCLTNNTFDLPSPWPICKPSNDFPITIFFTRALNHKNITDFVMFYQFSPCCAHIHVSVKRIVFNIKRCLFFWLCGSQAEAQNTESLNRLYSIRRLL